jgi:hypothetical protein
VDACCGALLQLHVQANAALMACTFAAMLRPTGDVAIMDPFGALPGQGFGASPKGLDRLGRFLRAGTMEVGRVAADAAGDHRADGGRGGRPAPAGLGAVRRRGLPPRGE